MVLEGFEHGVYLLCHLDEPHKNVFKYSHNNKQPLKTFKCGSIIIKIQHKLCKI